MKILLVFPRIEHGAIIHSDKGSWSSILFGYPIITLPHLAAITPRNHEVKIVNENYESIDFNEPADLVGITSYTMTAPRVYELADEFRRRGRRVVLGGYHPTAMPDEAKAHADSIVRGEAEGVWPELLQDAEKGKLHQLYGPNPDFDMAAIPPIRRDLIRQNPIAGAVQSTRGCPATKVGTAIVAVVPVVGRPILEILRGGKDVGAETLTRFFGLHVAILPATFTVVLTIHLLLVQLQGMHEPHHWEKLPASQKRYMPFFPNFILRDVLLWLIVLNVLAVLAVLFPWELGHKADPGMAAPAGIKPEWYFLFMYQALKYFPGKIGPVDGDAVGVLLFAVAGLFWMLRR